ncbi:LysM peptidoglycan-binding domain-containing protein [Georgenia alba]|uniref:LysM peptidoglycan-binding domain-containing protein n=1 Tax=Georgenia alba TaxID=2233858 RepID=A0ABW2Q5K6_9MICO
MLVRQSARPRHRTESVPAYFRLTSSEAAVLRRGTLAVATTGVAITIAAPTASADTTHTVASGDTVSELASQYDVSTSSILEANELDSSAIIYVGDQLTIPSGEEDGGSSGSGDSDATPTGSGDSGSTTTHTVASGDTVSALASEYGTTVDAIVERNGLDSSALIFVGQQLAIPAGSGAAPSTGGSAPSEEPAGGDSVDATRASVLEIARQHIGTPYVYGGESPGGFDCSGFTQYVYAQVGVELPRTTDDQAYAGTEVSESEALPGDLVWYPGHVGIYTGDGNYVAAWDYENPLSEREIWHSDPTFIRVL